MNPRVGIILFFTIVFLSCNTDVKEEKATTVSKPPKTLISETDTFCGGKNLLFVKDTTELAFKNLFKIVVDTCELNNLKQNSSAVKRKGDTLFITLNTNTVKTYISEPYKEGADNLTEYKYLGKIASIDYHLIYVGQYESFTYLMVNNKTGKETYVCGVPSVSPNKKYVATACFDLQAGFVFNGIQMYDVDTDSLKPNWSRELSKWGADNITWMDNDNLIVEKMYLDTSQNVHTAYVKISCSRK